MSGLRDISEGFELTPLERTPDAVDLFLYSAAVWLPHRIHYDVPYTTSVEDHPALLVQGPLQGVYLMQLVAANFPDAEATRFSFRHQVPVHVDQRLRCRGRVSHVDGESGEVTCEVWTELDDGRTATAGEVRLWPR